MRHSFTAFAALMPMIGIMALGSTTSANGATDSVKNQLVTLDQDQSATVTKGLATPEEVARQFLNQNAASLGLSPETPDLQLETVVKTPLGHHVRFQQVQNNMSVYQGNVVVTLNQSLQVVSYVNSYQTINHKENISLPKLRSTEAISTAYSALDLKSSPRYQQAIPMILVKDGNPEVIYRVRISAPVDKKYNWEILTDATDNHVLFSRDIAMSQKKADPVAAMVFDPNPTIRTGKSYGDPAAYSDNNNADNDFFNSNLVAVELLDMNKTNGVFDLTGKYVQISDFEYPLNPECKSSTPAMKYTRSQPCFDAVSVYYFIDKSLRYVNEILGIQAMPYQYAGGIKADPHGLNGDDNSHYLPSTGEIAYGEGGIDDAQDHDVVLHELGHAIHDWVTHGHLSQVEGLSEGAGDYWALSYARQFMKKDHIAYSWIFGFDGHNEFWPGRVADIPGQYPVEANHVFLDPYGNPAQDEFGNPIHNIHREGQIWSTTCLLVWEALGKQKTDKIFWSALAMLNETSSQADAANAFVKATQEISSADRATVVKIFQSKGYTVQ